MKIFKYFAFMRWQNLVCYASRLNRSQIKPLILDRVQQWTLLTLISMFLAIGLPQAFNRSNQANAVMVIQPPLSARGSDIVDATGQTVLLRGINWFGIETELHAPHGLWRRDYQEMLAQIKGLGYNVIRLPYSIESLQAAAIEGVDFSLGSNHDLQGKTPLEVMDLVIQEAERQGLLVLLDSHRLNSQRIPELWYGDGFTEDDWLNTWTMLASRYRDQRNVIGADLKNEPHGQASWGTGDRPTDWRLASERAGEAILRVNPDWLIVVEGVEKNVPGQRLAGHWWGGNLEGVKNYPVRLSNPNKLVYSPHEYGPGVVNQPWFSEPSFPENLNERWEIGFHYIASDEIAPIFVGEFGGRQVDQRSPEGIWQRRFIDYINRNNLSFSYWSWNPNSTDTGGILLDDWQTIDAPKQQLLNSVLSRGTVGTAPQPLPAESPLLPTASPTPSSPVPTPQIGVNPIASPSHATLSVESTVQSDWQTGFCFSMRVNNLSRFDSTDWRLSFQMNQAEISNSWNGTFARQGDRYTVVPPDWGRSIQPGQGVDLGFCANKQGTDFYPENVTITSPDVGN